jgi:hypothetical protein
LSSKYEMIDLGDLYVGFNLQIIRDIDNKMLFLSQLKYIQEKLEKFNLSHAKCMATPLEPKSNLENLNEIIQEEEQKMKKVACKSVGVEIYLGMTTRPGLATSSSIVAQYNSKPGHHHWSLVKKIFKYLKGTSTNGLVYNGNDGNLEVTSCWDFDWRRDAKRSKIKNMILFVLTNANFSWNNKLQHVVALSSAKVEYYGGGAAANEALWIRDILR